MFAPAAGGHEWVELKNGGTAPIHPAGCGLTDEDENWYVLPEALPEMPAGAFLVVVFDGQGAAADELDFGDNVATVHTQPWLVDIFEDGADQAALYGPPPYAISEIVSFVAWGANPGPDDDVAVTAGIWGEGLYKDLRQIGDETPLPIYPGRSLGLLPGGADSFSPNGWVHYQEAEVTQGQDNPVPGIAGYDPAPGATIDSATFAIGWQSVEGATVYHFQMDDNSNFASPEYDLTLDGPAFVPDESVPEGKYSWRVAVVQNAQTGPWSAPVEINSLTFTGMAGAGTARVAAAFTKVLGIQWQLQRKDTGMVCHAGDSETGNAPWDAPHPTTGAPTPHGDTYCERASISMLASYYGGHLSQDRIAYEDYQGEAVDQLGHTKSGNNTSIDVQLTWAGIPYTKAWSKPTFAQVKAWIDNDQPFITLRPGHFRVVDGYSEIEDLSGGPTQYWVHLLDPWNNARWVMWSGDATETVWVGPSGTGGAPGVRSDEDVDSDGVRDTVDDLDDDGLVDFDERVRFGTNATGSDSDSDGVPDKTDMREYVFNAAGQYSLRKADWDGDGLRKERDPDNDRKYNDGSSDGCEDANHNGKYEPDQSETSNFDASQESPCSSFYDDFSSYTPGQFPTGWSQSGSTVITPIVQEVGGVGPAYRLLSFNSVNPYYGKRVVKDNLSYGPVTVSTKINLRTNTDEAGLVVGFHDASSYTVVTVNPYWDEMVIWHYSAGQGGAVAGTGRGGLTVTTNVNYWLRVVRRADGTVEGYWFTNGTSFALKVTSPPLDTSRGQVGYNTSGYTAPAVYFDDFQAVP